MVRLAWVLDIVESRGHRFAEGLVLGCDDRDVSRIQAFLL